MKANNSLPEQSTKKCLLCKEPFKPHVKVKERQKVCSRPECQWLRQKLNQLDWVERNPVDYQKWYLDYGRAWRQKNPDYQQNYRKQKKARLTSARKVSATHQSLNSLHAFYRAEKKEELTSTKTKRTNIKPIAKKEELTHYFYLIKAKDLVSLPLCREKKRN